MKEITFGSVCSGIEAASVAWEPLGFWAEWFSEIEAFPSAVLAHHWPDVPNLGDMLTLPALVDAGEIAAPDVLVGGTPCQAFSVAGNRESLADARGGLTLAYVELADAIDRQRAREGQQPCVIVWENVPGVLSTKDNAFGCFLAGLAGEDVPLQPPGKRWTNAGIVLGPKRAIAWRILDAQYFGVAQRRRRVFVVASARDGFDPSAVLFEFDGLRRDSAPSREARQDVAEDAGTGTSRSGSHWDAVTNPHPSLNQSHNTGGIGASNQEVFSQRGCGLVQTPYHDVALCLNAGGMGRIDYESESMVVQTVALRGREGGATAELGGEVATALRASTGGGDKPHVLAFQPGNLRRGAGSPPSGDVFPTLKSDHGRGMSDQFPHVLSIGLVDTTGHQGDRFVSGGDVTQALSASAGNNAGGGGTCLLAPEMAVRRLTPTECERLQGFPDGHTDVPYRNKSAADGPRYKALGNSMAVPCMAFIGRRIAAALQ